MDAASLFTQHGSALARLAARITGDQEEARDIVADAFAALLAGGPSDPRHAVPWLYMAVRHRAYNRVRRQALAKRRLPALATETAAVVDQEPAVSHDPRVSALVSSATARLGERDRIAVWMRHVEQASYEDLAAALGTTVTQARVVVHRANAKLRRNVVASMSRRHGTARDRSMRVSDELAALLHTPVAVPPSWSTRVGDTVRRGWHRAQATTGRATRQVGELITPGIAFATVVAAGSTVPADAPRVPVAAPAAAETARLGVDDRHEVRVVGGAVGAPPASEGFTLDAIVASPVGVDGIIGSPVRFDDPGTEPKSSQSGQNLWSLLGIPMVEIDPPHDAVGPASPSTADIRSLELATLGDRNGRARALRWRIELIAPHDPSASNLYMHWGYEGSDCHTAFDWSTASNHAVFTLCPVLPEEASRRVPFRVELSPIEHGHSPVAVRVERNVIEATLDFQSLDERTGAFLRPGARMTGIMVHTKCPNGDRNCPEYDRAPDVNGYAYQVER